MEASSFTPQQALEQAAPGASPVPEVIPLNQLQFAANFMNFLKQMASAYVPPSPPPVAVITIEKLWKNAAEEFLSDQIADPMIAKRWFERTIRVLGNLRVPQDQRGLGEGQSTTRPPLFDGTNYTYWKERMRIFIQSNNFLLWRIIKNGEEVPMKKVGETTVPKNEDEYDAHDIKKIENNAKAINILYCAVNPDDYWKISCCSTAKEMWDKLEITYEGGQRKHSRTGKNVASSSAPPPPAHKYLDGSFLWFNDHAEATRFSEKFEHREILPPRFSTACFIHDSIPREARIILERGNFLDLLYIKKVNYQPFLIRAFYSNLKKDEDGALISNVNGVDIYLNEENIQILTGLRRDGQDLGLYVGEEGARFNETALLEEVGIRHFLSTPQQRRPTIASMSPVFRFIFYVLTRILKPRKFNHTTLSQEDTKTIHAMIHNANLNWPMPVMPNISREDLDNPVIVSNPLGHSLQLTHMYHDCPLVVQGKTFPASLIELPHREFDVILRMDWLTANQAVVDCGAHTVRLRAEDGSDILIRGELLPKAPEFISYIHARRLIRKKHEAFLCTVRDTRQEAPRKEDIPTTIELVSRGEKPDFTVQDDILYYQEHPTHILPVDLVTLDENLTYEEEPVEILAQEIRQLHNKEIPLVKVDMTIQVPTLEDIDDGKMGGARMSSIFEYM
ncbi:unnamed protein product [Cuscuta campestris]|uniref:DUF4219 domain-containing protein n=1 Tax=Cuscuta campestris TaxID=132261 RepID=A0A484KMK9_9ASTE|nr:unnamed protein product [Cuscuta campestris]